MLGRFLNAATVSSFDDVMESLMIVVSWSKDERIGLGIRSVESTDRKLGLYVFGQVSLLKAEVDTKSIVVVSINGYKQKNILHLNKRTIALNTQFPFSSRFPFDRGA